MDELGIGRWQLGALVPRGWSRAGGGAWWQETQCLALPATNADPGRPLRLLGHLRLLRLRRRYVHEQRRPIPWEEAERCAIDFGGTLESARRLTFHLPGDTVTKKRRSGTTVTWESVPISGNVLLTTAAVDAPAPLLRLGVRVENVTGWLAPNAPLDDAARASLLGVHLTLRLAGGKFVSLRDPPPWAAAAAAGCRSTRTSPILAGPSGHRSLMLSTPVVLRDGARAS